MKCSLWQQVTFICLGLLDWIAQFKNLENLTLHAFISTKYKIGQYLLHFY